MNNHGKGSTSTVPPQASRRNTLLNISTVKRFRTGARLDDPVKYGAVAIHDSGEKQKSQVWVTNVGAMLKYVAGYMCFPYGGSFNEITAQDPYLPHLKEP